MIPPKAVQRVFCFAELGARPHKWVGAPPACGGVPPPACGGHASVGFGLARHADGTLESETMGGGAR